MGCSSEFLLLMLRLDKLRWKSSPETFHRKIADIVLGKLAQG
jgi:hypothetical protein